MSSAERTPFKNPVIDWIDARLPVFTMMQREYGAFPTPRNFNWGWVFGALALVTLMIMIVTGVFLAMFYTPAADRAFGSVERIMRDVNYGWLIRTVHMNGASLFFIVVYIHLFRGVYYGSYKNPRELLWIFGVFILLAMMATAFMGYVLPWGQMSFWGATVITSLFSAIPFVGQDIVTWLWGGFTVDNPTLNRFFALHFLLPFVIVALVFLHVVALHIVGSNNPTGVEPKSPKDTVPFHPYYTSKDIFALGVFLTIYAALVFFAPDALSDPTNYIPANPMVTPEHIVPEWYFLPFYAILRAFTWDITVPFTSIVLISSKLGGVVLMFGAIGLLVALPWLDRSPVRSARYRPLTRALFWVWILDCLVLGYVGGKPPEGIYVILGQVATAWYFLHFLVVTPLVSRREKTLPLPESIADSVKKLTKASSLALLLVTVTAFPAVASENPSHLRAPDGGWPHQGVTGAYDPAALRRGFEVYKQVCGNCHSLNLLAYRHLQGIGLSADEIKNEAAAHKVTDGPNDQGTMFERAARPSDSFVKPFPNDAAARVANNGALPPDLSLIVKAREGHEDYLFSLLTGYGDAPPTEKVADGLFYNTAFPGHQIAMPPVLMEGVITFADGTMATIPQMAKDITQFLAWAGDPHADARKRLGMKVVLFLAVFTVILGLVKRRVWRGLKP